MFLSNVKSFGKTLVLQKPDLTETSTWYSRRLRY